MGNLVSFREVEPCDAEQLLAWRGSDRVTRWMNTDVSDDVEAQRRWIESSYAKPSYYHWILRLHDEDAGLVSIADFNIDQGLTSWGYYIGNEDATGSGAYVPPFIYNWLFFFLQVRRIDIEVFEQNEPVLRMHAFHGYQRVPERDRTIRKNGSDITLLSLKLEAETWFGKTRFHRFTADLPVRRWKAAPKRHWSSWPSQRGGDLIA